MLWIAGYRIAEIVHTPMYMMEETSITQYHKFHPFEDEDNIKAAKTR